MNIIEIPKWGRYLRETWRKQFVSHLTKDQQDAIYLDSFLWHLCSWKKVKCLEKDQAIQAFENEIKTKCTIFYQFTDEAYLIENAKNLTINDLQYQENQMYYGDIYIMDWDYQRTFMKLTKIAWDLDRILFGKRRKNDNLSCSIHLVKSNRS